MRRPLLHRAVLAPVFRVARSVCSRVASAVAFQVASHGAWCFAFCVGLCLPLRAGAQELTISAASSLGNAMRDIGSSYQAAHPGVKLSFNFAASGALLAQLQQGAPVDVFASADLDTMDRAEAAKLTRPETRLNFAANELVLVSPLSRPPAARTLAGLAGAGVRRIAVGTPSSVPAGRYAQAALEAQGLWIALAPKLVFADNVRQALNYVSRAEVDAALVYRTDALIDTAQVRIDAVLPTAQPVLYPIAVVALSRHAAAAAEFVRFVAGPPGQAVLARHGFRSP